LNFGVDWGAQLTDKTRYFSLLLLIKTGCTRRHVAEDFTSRFDVVDVCIVSTPPFEEIFDAAIMAMRLVTTLQSLRIVFQKFAQLADRGRCATKKTFGAFEPLALDSL
jgi:hypothetical protein